MKGILRPRVKVCCISSPEEARLAISYGASALGLVGHMPSGPGIISDAMTRKIATDIPPGVSSFLLTSETRAEDIIAHHSKVYTTAIQMVDELEEAKYQQIKEALPGIKLVQVIHVVDEHSVEEAVRISQQVDALLLDSGNPSLAIKELGGTGRVHNWDLSRKIREEVDIPLFLAGGLHPGNVRQAIEHVQPFGLDLCSGLRTQGKLDEEKLLAFFQSIDDV